MAKHPVQRYSVCKNSNLLRADCACEDPSKVPNTPHSTSSLKLSSDHPNQFPVVTRRPRPRSSFLLETMPRRGKTDRFGPSSFCTALSLNGRVSRPPDSGLREPEGGDIKNFWMQGSEGPEIKVVENPSRHAQRLQLSRRFKTKKRLFSPGGENGKREAKVSPQGCGDMSYPYRYLIK